MSTPSPRLHATSGAIRRRSAWRRWALATLLGLGSLASGQPALAQPVKSLVFAGDANPDEMGSRWGVMIYREAGRRLGVPIEVRNYPLARRATELDQGNIDGDSGRVQQYGDSHPNLVRVDAPFSDMVFALYTADPALSLRTLDDLRGTDLYAEYRRGIVFCERTLKSVMPPDHVGDLSSEEQGLNKLLAGRTALYCDLEYAVRSVLNTPEFRPKTQLRKVLTLGAVPIFPYLHRKHADLAPRLAATLKAMRGEGVIDAYRVQIEREMGWTR